MKKNTIQPFILYLFSKGDTYYGATRAILKDGFDEIYQYGWKIEDDPSKKRNGFTLNKSRARTNVKNRLSNTLNALNCYGKKVLDEDGNIDWEKFRLEEFKSAKQGIQVTLEYKKPLIKFKVKDITFEEAKKLDLI